MTKPTRMSIYRLLVLAMRSIPTLRPIPNRVGQRLIDLHSLKHQHFLPQCIGTGSTQESASRDLNASFALYVEGHVEGFDSAKGDHRQSDSHSAECVFEYFLFKWI